MNDATSTADIKKLDAKIIAKVIKNFPLANWKKQ
jgi:hypothetical protein